MKTQTKTVVLTVFVLAGIAIAVFSARIVRRERARAGFSGCNLAHLNIAAIDRGVAQIDLETAERDANTPPEKLELLRQRFKEADARFKKWDAHVKKYGHLSGTAKTETR